MEIWKRYFTSRYVLFFTLFFIVWYPGTWILFTVYQAAPHAVLYIALNLYYPIVLGLVAFFYFRKSVNDWNDRFFVAFGWVIVSFLLSALLVQSVYGNAWTTIMNWEVVKTNWVGVFVVLVAAFFAKKRIV